MSRLPSPHVVSPRSRAACRPFALGALLVLLSACSVGPKGPLSVIDLPPQSGAPAPSGAPLALQLEVPEPAASALLDSPRMVVRGPDGGLAQLAGVALPERAPRWLQSRLIGALAARPFAAVTAPGAGARPDLRLLLRIERFELDYRGAPQAAVALHAVLLDATLGRALASTRVEQAAPVDGRGSAAGAEALQRATLSAVDALAEWTEAQARRAGSEHE